MTGTPGPAGSRRGTRTLRRIAWPVACLLWALPVLAQSPPAAPPEAEAPLQAPVATAPVSIDGTMLFQVRGVTAFPAEERAANIAARIRGFARNTALAPDAVQIVAQTDFTNIVAGSDVLATVVDADAQLEGITRAVMAEVMRRQIITAVTAYRQDRSPQALLRGSLRALGALVVLVVVLVALRFGFRILDRVITRRLETRVRDVQERWLRFVHTDHLWSSLRAALRALYWLLAVTAVIVSVRAGLGAFPWTRELGNNLGNLVLGPLTVMGLGFVEQLPNLVFLAILVLVTRYVLGFIRLFFEAVARGTIELSSFDPEWGLPTYRLVRVGVIAFAVVIAYPYVPGSQTDAFRGVSVFLGVIFSLGSSSVIGNVIAGYSMTYRRAFRPGDRVRIDEHLGDIVEVHLLVTRLRTPKNEEVVIPNSAIINGSVVNYSTMAREGKLILHTTVGIGYETPWRQVEAMLLEAAGRTEGLLPDPAPFVLQKSLGDFAITYEINAACREAHIMNVIYTRLHRNILDVFNEHGVQIMTPAYEGDPAQPKVVPKDQWYIPPAAPAATGA